VGVTLILGRIEDPCCRLVKEQLVEQGREALMLPEDRMLPRLRFAWTPSSSAQLGGVRYDGQDLDFADVDGILSRAWSVPVAAEDFASADGRYICAEWNALLMAWLHAMPCPVINRLRPQLWYKVQLNVPDLAALIPEIGLNLPRFIVTTDIAEANAFCRSVRGPVRYSPLTQASQYRIQTAADREKLAALVGSLPLYLAECIEGEAIEAFVVRSEVLFVDRAGKLLNETGEGVAPRCVAASAALGLTFCKLSLLAAPQGEWYCLGIDRAPQLYRLAAETQMRIARGLTKVFSTPQGDS
jgi:hypothetical protein